MQNYGVFSQYSSLNRVSGFYSNPAPYAAILVGLVGFSISKLTFGISDFNQSKYNSKLEYVLFIIFLIGVCTIVLTKSRAAYLALILGPTILFKIKIEWTERVSKYFRISRKFLFPTLCLIAFILLFSMYFLRPDSAYGRLLIWKIALIEMFPDKPVFGHGMDAFQNHYMHYQSQFFENNYSTVGQQFSVANTPYAFNEFMKILIEEGIVGLILFCNVICSAFYFGFKRLSVSVKKINKEVLVAALISFLAVIVFSSFSYPFSDITSKTIFYIILAVISSQTTTLKSHNRTKLSSLILSCCCFPMLIWSFQTQFYKYDAYKKWRNYNHISNNVKELENLKPIFKEQGLYYIDYADALYKDNQKEHAIKILEEGKKYTSNPSLYLKLGRYYDEGLNNVEKAELAYNKVSSSLPYKFYPKYKLLRMYERNNLTAKAKKTASEIIKMPIKVKSKNIQNYIDYARKVIEKRES